MPSGVRVQVSPGLPTISMRRVWAIGSPAVPKTAAPQGHRSSNLLPSAKILSRDVPGRAACFQTKRMGFESSSRRQRRARQMVSQHTANVPSVHARLGSIPRLSAKLVSKKGSGVRRIRLAAPACRAECSIGASRFESGDTHQKGPVVQLAEATGSKSVESGFESQRGHQQSSTE